MYVQICDFANACFKHLKSLKLTLIVYMNEKARFMETALEMH